MAGNTSSKPSNAELLRGLEHLSIEDAYFQAWGRVGGAGRLRRTFSLSAEIRRMVEFQIRKKHPELDACEVKRLTAQRMYLSDDAPQQLLDRSRGRTRADRRPAGNHAKNHDDSRRPRTKIPLHWRHCSHILR